jgi:hypothetical protein
MRLEFKIIRPSNILKTLERANGHTLEAGGVISVVVSCDVGTTAVAAADDDNSDSSLRVTRFPTYAKRQSDYSSSIHFIDLLLEIRR